MSVDRGTYFERRAAEADWEQWSNNFETKRRLDVIFGHLLPQREIEGRKLLDAGSGGGHFSARACALGAVVTSLDVGENLLAQVAKRCDSTRVVGSVLELPFPDDSFDVVMSTEVIEHTVEPERALRELVRVVRPGGRVVVTTPGKLWQPVVRAASVLRVREHQGHENFLWPHVAKRTLEGAGLRVDELFGFNLLPLFRPSFGPLLSLFDLAGEKLPSLYVNFAIAGSKR